MLSQKENRLLARCYILAKMRNKIISPTILVLEIGKNGHTGVNQYSSVAVLF